MKDPGCPKKDNTKSRSKKSKHKKDFIKLKDVPLDVLESIAANAKSSKASNSPPANDDDKQMSLDEYKKLLISDNIDVLSSMLNVEGYRHKTPVKILEELRTKCLLDYELAFKACNEKGSELSYLCALGSLCTSGTHPTNVKTAKHSSARAMLEKILPTFTSYYELQEFVKRNPKVIVKKGKLQQVTAQVNGKVPEGPRPPCKYPATFDI